MPAVLRELAKHHLKTDPNLKPVKQFLRWFNDERRYAIGEEIAWLLAAGFIMEVFHPKWLANLVLISKKIGTRCDSTGHKIVYADSLGLHVVFTMIRHGMQLIIPIHGGYIWSRYRLLKRLFIS